MPNFAANGCAGVFEVLDDLQGNVLRAYRDHAHTHYLFATISDPERSRNWLARHVRSAGEAGDAPHNIHTTAPITTRWIWRKYEPELTLNIAFTFRGLVRLGVAEEAFAGLDAFRQGMAERAAALGDVDRSAPEHWEEGLEENDVLMVLTADDPARLADGPRLAVEAGLAVIGGPHEGSRPADHREHFGFDDGFSQPAIAGVDSRANAVGEGTMTAAKVWRTIALGEFVLGYPDEGGGLPQAPASPLGVDSTFMVVRKLAQDVAGFRSYTRQVAHDLGVKTMYVRAKMVGRWPNGSSTERHPHEEGPPATGRRANRFGYGEDPDGSRCPLGAHVRRGNPRDSALWQGRPTLRHRIIRRGVPYGEPLAEEGEDGTEQDADAEGTAAREYENGEYKRGLMFVCYQADIERQFEFIQSRWLGDGNSLGVGTDRDPLLSPGLRDRDSGRMIIPDTPPLFLEELRSFVTTRGGGYYLLPGAHGLRALSRMRA